MSRRSSRRSRSGSSAPSRPVGWPLSGWSARPGWLSRSSCSARPGSSAGCRPGRWLDWRRPPGRRGRCHPACGVSQKRSRRPSIKTLPCRRDRAGCPEGRSGLPQSRRDSRCRGRPPVAARSVRLSPSKDPRALGPNCRGERSADSVDPDDCYRDWSARRSRRRCSSSVCLRSHPDRRPARQAVRYRRSLYCAVR